MDGEGGKGDEEVTGIRLGDERVPPFADDAPRNAQRAVEVAVIQPAAVRLGVEPRIVRIGERRRTFEFEGGGIGMARGDLEALGGIADAEGDQGAAAARDEVFPAACKRPRLLFGKLRKAVLEQTGARILRRLIGGIRSFKKIE